jgi:hypothetical protein
VLEAVMGALIGEIDLAARFSEYAALKARSISQRGWRRASA